MFSGFLMVRQACISAIGCKSITYEGNISLQIADPVGKIYDIGRFRLNSAELKNFEVDISNLFLRSGIYFLRIHSDLRKTEVIKLILQE